MKWSFSYRVIFNDKVITLSTVLRDAGVTSGSVFKLGISGTYEDVWEKELKDMWDGTKLYNMVSALEFEANLKERLRRRGILNSDRLRELADACFSHV